MKRKALLLPLSGLLLAFLNGCGLTVWNVTQQNVAPNPTSVYTFTLAADLDKRRNIYDDSVRAQLIIDGQTFIMKRSKGSPNLFTYDYRIPVGSEARYYYILEYDYKENLTSKRKPKRYTTSIYHLHLNDDSSYESPFNEFNFPQEIATSYRLQNERGSTGSIVSVSGQGLSATDRILIGGIHADTVFETKDTLTFRVPDLDAGRTYPVYLQSVYRTDFIGDFFVESSSLRVNPNPVSIRSGESQDVVFSIDFVAPSGGLPIDVTTDIPSSVIMPEVVIPEGAQTVDVSIQGGLPANGALFVDADGLSEFTVPINVTP